MDSKLTYSPSRNGHLRLLAILLLMLGPVVLSFSQKKELAEADKFYNEKKYGEAFVAYQKFYDKKKDRKILLKMADCNYLNENYPQAHKYYALYFRDSIYENIPQFVNYAKCSKMNGKLVLATRLYQKIYEITQDASAKSNYELGKYYLDNIANVRAFDLDEKYGCTTLDGKKYIDSVKVPLFYLWDFGDGKNGEGVIVEHCFPKSGENKVVLNARNRNEDDTLNKINKDTVISVYVLGPDVKFNSPKIGQKYFYLDFDASNVEISGYEVLEYLWDMDNGEIMPGKKIKYRYSECTNYNVKLTVIAQSKYTSNRELYSSFRKIEIKESYEMPSKKFSDSLNESK